MAERDSIHHEATIRSEQPLVDASALIGTNSVTAIPGSDPAQVDYHGTLADLSAFMVPNLDP
jgi:hypothetical protein